VAIDAEWYAFKLIAKLLEAVPNSLDPSIDLGIQARVDNFVAGWTANQDNTLLVALVHLLLAAAPT